VVVGINAKMVKTGDTNCVSIPLSQALMKVGKVSRYSGGVELLSKVVHKDKCLFIDCSAGASTIGRHLNS